MMSRPPIPSSKAATKEFEWRVHYITALIEAYHPGGCHRIHLGDGDRYTILRKLSYGSFSTVWLARYAQPISFG